MRRAAANGSDAVPSTSMSGSLASTSARVWRTRAESSTISTRIFFFIAFSCPAEHGTGEALQRQLEAGKGFGMAEEQEATPPQMPAQPQQHRVLHLRLEIDQDVAAED